MSDWLRLVEALAWPVLVTGLLLYFRRALRAIAQATVDRITQGASFEAGPGGLKLGATAQEPTTANVAPDTRARGDLPHPIYMSHWTKRDSSLDRAGRQYYQIWIWLDADEPPMMNEVKDVLYHLHPTFADPDRLVHDRRTAFALRTAAWGEFNMTAEVRFLDGRAPLLIERYINFFQPPSHMS